MAPVANLQENLFLNKTDFSAAFEVILEPLLPYYEKGEKGHLKLGSTGAVYDDDIQQIEAFLRPLWGLGPYLAHKNWKEVEDFYLAGIRAGINPEAAEYWGKTHDYDQRLVEMASIANTLLLAKEHTWDRLTELEQDALYNWLMQINQHTIPLSNWLFFRILVNIAMKKCGREWNQEQVERDFEVINRCYIGNGWYYDETPSQVDYYISFAFHFYSLIYYKHMQTEDPDRCEWIKNRAIQFAQTFKYWFDEKGVGIPIGRSLTYRFSQCAFWTALVFADIPALEWGEIKGIISRNMQYWLSKDIFTNEGLLSIGYHYPNLLMAEGYNAPGSPYWALKSFLMLAVPDEHPYWQAEVIPVRYPSSQIAIPEARMLITQSKKQTQVFPAGLMERKQAHVDAKYSKFVYSTVFGFSVSKGSVFYKQGGFDNCLALAEGDMYYRSKLEVETYQIHEEFVNCVWRPWEDVLVETTILPFDGWHVRIHDIETGRKLHAVEGGFSIPINAADIIQIDGNGVRYTSEVGISSIYGLHGFDSPAVQTPEPNTNVYFPRSCYPTVEATLEIGKYRLVSLVGGTVEKDEEKPQIDFQAEFIEITYRGVTKRVPLIGGMF